MEITDCLIVTMISLIKAVEALQLSPPPHTKNIAHTMAILHTPAALDLDDEAPQVCTGLRSDMLSVNTHMCW